MTCLRKWFEVKFQAWVTSPQWLDSHLEDLIQGYLEDRFLEDDDAAREARHKHLHGVVPGVYDPLIELWERQIAAGQDPDLDIAEDDIAKRRDAKVKEAAQRHYEATGQRLYKAPLPAAVAYAEAIREGQDGFDVLSGMGGVAEKLKAALGGNPQLRAMAEQYIAENGMPDASQLAALADMVHEGTPIFGAGRSQRSRHGDRGPSHAAPQVSPTNTTRSQARVESEDLLTKVPREAFDAFVSGAGMLNKG